MVRNQSSFMSIASTIRTAILVALIVATGPSLGPADDTTQQDSSKPKTLLRLVIDYGDGVQKHFTQLEYTSGMTVWNLLEAAQKHPRGIQVKSRGKDDTLLVTAIDGQANEGGTSSRNWIFRVNDELGERSAGITPVQAKDVITWRYERFTE